MKSFVKMKLLFTILIICASSIGSASVPIMPAEEVKPGMRAVCRTVFQGTTIEEFELEILEIIENYAPRNDVYLVKLTSPNALKTGVVSGMSGSPVYIDGKLIGALAYRFGTFTKEPIGGVTPIQQMLSILEKEKSRTQERAMSAVPQEFPFELVLNFSQSQTELENEFISYVSQGRLTGGTGNVLQPIRLPISVSGLNPDLRPKFSTIMEKMGQQLVQGGSSRGSVDESIPILPGSAVAGIIIDGDVNVSATGTVTWVDEDKILAFGHPFLGSGPISVPFAPAKILTTISSEYNSYKMSQSGKIVGTIHQDRTSGIMGVLNETPEMIPLTLKYISPFDEEYDFNFRLAEDKTVSSIVPYYMWMALYNAVYSARMGAGNYNTTLSGQIHIADHDDIILDNFFAGTSEGEDASASTMEPALLISALMNNKFLVPKIESIDLELRSTLGNNSATIEQAWYDKAQVKPGESIDFNIFIRPYQRELVKLSQKIDIPENLESGIYTIVIGGAGFITRVENSLAPGKFQPHNFSHLVKLLNQRRKNNILTVQLRKPENGKIIYDQEFTGLPPSVLRIMNSKKTDNKTGKLHDVTIVEKQMQVDWDLDGGQLIRIYVTKEK